MKPNPNRTRKLHRGHFAFMRAVVQGVDARKAWGLYLRGEGESDDLRRVKSAIAGMRAEFAAAARREGKGGEARLILMDAALQPDAEKLPTLDEFARERGMEDFSEAEQAEAYESAYGAATRRSMRRGQLVNRQLDALRWLEDLVAQDPKPGDAVASWLTPALADRIERAGMPTLFALIERINTVGARWWSGVPGIGELKAERIVEWLASHEKTIGMRIASFALKPRTQLQPVELAAVVPRSTGLVPLEKFLVPAELDGSAGRFRANAELCMLGATNDYEAIGAWLSSKGSDPATETPTQRAYRKEAERLLLWAILIKGKALSSLNAEDAIEYSAFLQKPPHDWCGPRYHQRWSPQWRPFEGGLHVAARRHSLVILRSLFAFLNETNYLMGNPFKTMKLPKVRKEVGEGKALTFAQWDFIKSQLGKDPDSAVARRRDRAIRWLYATGLRLSEMVNARCSHLQWKQYADSEKRPVRGWMLEVRGKGDVVRQVPVPDDLVDELQEELARMQRPAKVTDPANEDVPIIARFNSRGEPLTWSDSGLYKALQGFMKACAGQLDGEDAKAVERATTHWLRHTHATHLLTGREAHADPVGQLVVMHNLGHASLATTSGYLHSEKGDRLKTLKRVWAQNKQGEKKAAE